MYFPFFCKPQISPLTAPHPRHVYCTLSRFRLGKELEASLFPFAAVPRAPLSRKVVLFRSTDKALQTNFLFRFCCSAFDRKRKRKSKDISPLQFRVPMGTFFCGLQFPSIFRLISLLFIFFFFCTVRPQRIEIVRADSEDGDFDFGVGAVREGGEVTLLCR